MKSRDELTQHLTKGTGPLTQMSQLHFKALEAILETLLDIRELQSAFNERLLGPKADVDKQ
jgi:hypothetical protein